MAEATVERSFSVLLQAEKLNVPVQETKAQDAFNPTR